MEDWHGSELPDRVRHRGAGEVQEEDERGGVNNTLPVK